MTVAHDCPTCHRPWPRDDETSTSKTGGEFHGVLIGGKIDYVATNAHGVSFGISDKLLKQGNKTGPIWYTRKAGLVPLVVHRQNESRTLRRVIGGDYKEIEEITTDQELVEYVKGYRP